MNSNSEVSDDHIIQINQSHEQTPIATSTNSPAPKHESRGVNEMTPEELSSLKKDLIRHVCGDQWLQVKSIIDKCPNMVRFPLNDSGNTALHLAAERNRGEIVKELVKRMRPEDMQIQNSSGDTALHLAVHYERLEIVNELVNRMRPEDMLIQNSRGDTALHLALSEGRGEIVNELVKRMRPEDMLIQNSMGYPALHLALYIRSLEIVKELVNRMRPEDMLIPNSSGDTALHVAVDRGSLEIVKELVNRMRPEDMLTPNSSGDTALHVAIHRDEFDLATLLFEKHPTTLAIARNKENLTALHMLARKPPKILDMEDGKESEGGRLFKKLWTQVNQLEHKWMIMSPVLFDAIKSGNVEVAMWIIEIQPELVTIKDTENGRNPLHLVVLFQQKRILCSIPWTVDEHLLREVDNEGNNILHLAAHLPPVEFEDFSSFRASINQMQRDIAWFKYVESNVPRELRTMRNNMGKTPIDVFYEEHKKLSEEIKETAKGIAESGMLVSTLVATVAFAAAVTVPGDKTNAWFPIFILTNAVALFASSASLLSFLSNFTSSRFAKSEFVISLHPSLTFGRWLLIISVAAMVVAFTAASFLIFDHTSKWVSYAVASMGLFPLLLFLLFQFNFFDKYLWSRFYRLSKVDKLTYYSRLQAE